MDTEHMTHPHVLVSSVDAATLSSPISWSTLPSDIVVMDLIVSNQPSRFVLKRDAKRCLRALTLPALEPSVDPAAPYLRARRRLMVRTMMKPMRKRRAVAVAVVTAMTTPVPTLTVPAAAPAATPPTIPAAWAALRPGRQTKDPYVFTHVSSKLHGLLLHSFTSSQMNPSIPS